jgi:DNA-binding MarR family transcriptional regulator
VTADDAVAQAWRVLAQVMAAGRDRFLAIATEVGLTPAQTHALLSLADGPVKMRSLADCLVCDASSVTAIVDRLEALGLAERTASLHDRRVKEIVLTGAGRRTVEALHGALFDPPAALRRLSEADQQHFARIVAALQPGPAGPPPLG